MDSHTSPIGSERRKETRYRVELKGRLKCNEKFLPLEIGDLSGSGALIFVKEGPQKGLSAELWIEDYGPIAIRIMHSGMYFCGVAFVDAAAHRPALLRWLGEDAFPESHAA